jgi:hypothetical protein
MNSWGQSGWKITARARHDSARNVIFVFYRDHSDADETTIPRIPDDDAVVRLGRVDAVQASTRRVVTP